MTFFQYVTTIARVCKENLDIIFLLTIYLAVVVLILGLLL